jgi:hypothetical protein
LSQYLLLSVSPLRRGVTEETKGGGGFFFGRLVEASWGFNIFPIKFRSPIKFPYCLTHPDFRVE